MAKVTVVYEYEILLDTYPEDCDTLEKALEIDKSYMEDDVETIAETFGENVASVKWEV